MSFGLAWLSWRHIERPFRAKGVLGRGTIFTLSLSSLALFCALGIAGSLLNGWPSRLSPEERALIASVQVSPKRSLCNVSPDNALEPEDACVFNGDVPQVAVFGDSHTVELAYALGALARDRNIAVAQYSRAACNPAYGKTDDDPCTAWTHDAVETILAADTITDVVISYRMAAALYGATNEAYPDFVDDRTEEDRSATWAAFLDVLDAFRAGGKRVYFVIQVPELHRDVQHLVSAAAGQPAEDALPGVTRDWWDRRIGDVMDRLHELPAGVTVIDPTGFFCDRTRCYATRDGRALYFDDDHMSVYGAKLVARPVLAAILRHVSGP
ncbi:MAG: SGNH hydrolase domain-containing protein [Pseudomonadota bacterium]